MKKSLSLAEVKELYGNVREVESGYVVGNYGKYGPRITFVIPKEFNIGKVYNMLEEEVIDPLKYATDDEMAAEMNMSFNGKPRFIFGNFWVSPKGTNCFRPQDPMSAEHILIRIEWGGSYSKTRGLSEDQLVETGAIYHHKARSNGGGEGYDYLVLPVGYKKPIYDPEFDGPESIVIEEDHETRAMSYRKKHREFLDKRIAEGERFLKERAESLTEKERLKDRIAKLKERGDDRLSFDYGLEKDRFIFCIDKYYYSERTISMVERSFALQDEWSAKHKSE